jgi:hypothetical protein
MTPPFHSGTISAGRGSWTTSRAAGTLARSDQPHIGRCQSYDSADVWLFRGVRLVQTAPAIGVREAPHLAGCYMLALEDLRAGRRFKDAVTFGGFCVDIHDVKPGEKSAHGTKIQPYEIPYRCLLP